MLGKSRGMQPYASATAVWAADPRVPVASTLRARRHRKQPEYFARLTPSNAFPSDCELNVKALTLLNPSLAHQRAAMYRTKALGPAAAGQPTSKTAKVAQPEAPPTATSRHLGRRICKVIPLPDGGKAVETEMATSAHPYHIFLPWAFGSECFPHPPCDVHLKVLVDDQPTDLGSASGHVRRYTASNGRTQYNVFYKTGLWNSYPGHVITKLSTNSSSSELTCHLMSPAAQQAGAVAEAAAIAATVGQAYWYEQQKVFGPALLTRTPGSNSNTPVMVVVAIYKDSELASRANQSLTIWQKVRIIRVPQEVRQQLSGLKLVRFRAAKPNLLELYFSSEESQETATAAAAPVPPSNRKQPAAPPPNNQQAGMPAARFAAGRMHMPSATATLAKQHAPAPAATTSAPAASDGALPTLGNAAAAATVGRLAAAAATRAGDSAAATRDPVQGSAARSSTKHQAESVLQEEHQLGTQQQTGTTAATGMIDLTISSDDEAEELPNARLGATAAVKTVEAAPTAGQGTIESTGTAAAATGAGAAVPVTPLVAADTAPAASTTLGPKVEAHPAVRDQPRLMAVQTATAANDLTRAAAIPAGFSLEPFRSVPLAFQQLVLLLEVLTAPDELIQQLLAAVQVMMDAEGAAGWSRRLEVLEMHYCIVQACVRRGRADLALDAVGVLLDRAVK